MFNTCYFLQTWFRLKTFLVLQPIRFSSKYQRRDLILSFPLSSQAIHHLRIDQQFKVVNVIKIHFSVFWQWYLTSFYFKISVKWLKHKYFIVQVMPYKRYVVYNKSILNFDPKQNSNLKTIEL